MSENRTIPIAPLTREGFAPYGEVLSTEGAHHFPINGGTTERFHDLAAIRCEGPDARPLLSIFRGQPVVLPLALTLMERHPLGSQAFFPLDPRPFLVTVARDENGRPGRPEAFLVPPRTGINIALGTWHGVLTALEAQSDFLVVDRGGFGDNCEEHTFETPWIVAPLSNP